MTTPRSAEIEKNFQFFQGYVATLMPASAGKYALLRGQSCVDVYDTVLAAVRAGEARFHDNVFSVQEVTDTPLDLGFFSHAHPVG